MKSKTAKKNSKKQNNRNQTMNNHWTVVILLPIIIGIIGLFTFNANDIMPVKLLDEQLIDLEYINNSSSNIGGYVVNTDNINPHDYFLKGCVLNTNINNPKSKTVAVTKCRLKIKDIDKNYDTDEFGIVSNIIGNQLKISIVNNSLHDISGVHATLSPVKHDLTNGTFTDINLDTQLAASHTNLNSTFNISGGEVKELFSLDLNDDMRKLFDGSYWIYFYVDLTEAGSEQSLFAGTLAYMEKYNQFDIFFLQGDSEDVGFYTHVIDVDNISSGDIVEIPITNNIDERTVQNMQLIIGATKSCAVTLSAQFVINDKKILETNDYTAKIKVPIYNTLEGPYPYEQLREFMYENKISNFQYSTENAKRFSIFYNPYSYFQ